MDKISEDFFNFFTHNIHGRPIMMLTAYRPDLKREQWQAAASVVKSTADDLEDKELRTTFINAKPVQEILENANR